jgi:dTDP-4-amino-4,6-dideoxygalactose transaminase
MSQRRLVSLYFASVGLSEALTIVRAVLASPFIRSEARRAKLQDEASRCFNGAASFAYTSARGALAACLSAAKVGPDDEVLLSAFTCLAVPTAVLAADAKPRYCDIDPRTLNITPESVKAAITAKTRAVVVQHTLGSAAQVAEIMQMVSRLGILVIEDCALAIGTKRSGRLVGSFGNATIFSMELSKTISVGWGGILIVNDAKLAARVADGYHRARQLPPTRILRMALQTAICGILYLPRLYRQGRKFVTAGFKFRLFGPSTPAAENEGRVAADFVSKLAGPQAALGVRQWARLGDIARSCESNGTRIRKCLKNLGYIPLGSFGEEFLSVSPRVPFLVANRLAIMEWFRVTGVELGSWFDGPLTPLPEAAVFAYNRNGFPNALFIAEHIVNIPCHSRLISSDIDRIEGAMSQYAAAHPEDLQIQRRLQEL